MNAAYGNAMNELREWIKVHWGPAVPALKQIERHIGLRQDDPRNEFIVKGNKLHGLRSSRVRSTAPETYSQSGEDIILAGLLRAHARAQKRSMESMFYIEIGANQPIATSNSYLLYKKFGARGVLVEANEKLIADLRRVRPRDEVVHTAISTSREPTLTFHVGNAHELSSLNAEHIRSFGSFGGIGGISEEITVQNIHINDFLEAYARREIDLLSIDCEGIDYDLLQEADLEHIRPFIVMCEPGEGFMAGNSIRMIELMARRSYRLIASTDVNLIFVAEPT